MGTTGEKRLENGELTITFGEVKEIKDHSKCVYGILRFGGHEERTKDGVEIGSSLVWNHDFKFTVDGPSRKFNEFQIFLYSKRDDGTYSKFGELRVENLAEMIATSEREVRNKWFNVHDPNSGSSPTKVCSILLEIEFKPDPQLPEGRPQRKDVQLPTTVQNQQSDDNLHSVQTPLSNVDPLANKSLQRDENKQDQNPTPHGEEQQQTKQGKPSDDQKENSGKKKTLCKRMKKTICRRMKKDCGVATILGGITSLLGGITSLLYIIYPRGCCSDDEDADSS